jgi:phytoene dehydrogenase-like protein
MSTPPVAIVGAGLSGLTCALELLENGVPFQIFEASDAPGGRVRTDVVEGFRLDRGFQVYLTAYPEGKRHLDYKELQFGRFLPGAMVRHGGRFHRVMDPWREPFAALAHILNPMGSMADKLRVARLRAACMAGTPESIFQRPESTAMQYLVDCGFSQNMIERFFQPFFGGIMLDSQLRPSSRMLEYVFRMMAEGDTVLPALGMGAIPNQLAARLPDGSIHLNCPVAAVSDRKITLADGTEIPAAAVVVATEGNAANRLLPKLPPVEGRKVLCIYFAIQGKPPIDDPIVVMNGNLEWPIHNLVIPSVVCPTYAPEGYHLLGVTVLGDPKQEPHLVESMVRSQLTRWFGQDVARWRKITAYRIPYAHPVPTPPTVVEREVLLDNGVFICGDHRFFPSINAAMLTGRHAAEAIIGLLGRG